MKMQHKNIHFEIKVVDEASRTIEGYGAVFGNVDSYGDIIMPGAFANSLKKARKPRMLCQHQWDKVIGVWDEVREDARGLYLKGTLAKTPLADEYYELLKMQAIDGFSIGYTTIESEKQDDKRLLKEVDLWEVSIVTFPANEEARVTGVKSSPHVTEREFEEFLREAGYPRDAAKIIIARGFKALTDLREADNVVLNAAEKFADFLNNLKTN